MQFLECLCTAATESSMHRPQLTAVGEVQEGRGGEHHREGCNEGEESLAASQKT